VLLGRSQGTARASLCQKPHLTTQIVAIEADTVIKNLALASGEIIEGAYAVWIEQNCRKVGRKIQNKRVSRKENKPRRAASSCEREKVLSSSARHLSSLFRFLIS